MRKLIFVPILAFLLFSGPAWAMDRPEATSVSCGIGPHWGGVGFNYVTVPEDHDLGLSVGVGWLHDVGYSGGVVVRLQPEHGIFLTYVSEVARSTNREWVERWDPDFWPTDVSSGYSIMYGNIPVDASDFVWRMGASVDEDGDGWIFDLGIGITF